jgi:hypothetical protein
MRKLTWFVFFLGLFLIAISYCGIGVLPVARSQQAGAPPEDLPPSPLEEFAGRSTAKEVWSKPIGSLEGSEARATVTAIAVEDSTQTPPLMRGVRIDLRHLVPNPQCDQIYPAWTVMCKRANAAVFVEEARLDEVRTWLGRGSAQLRHAEYISQYGSRADGKESTGLIVCGYTFPGSTPGDLANMFKSAIDELRTAPR